MHAQNWHDTLTLLCMMILADGKVFPEEVKTFKKAAVDLRNAVSPNLMLTEHMAMDWFLLHRDKILTSMSSVYFPDTIATLLKNLNSVPNKKNLILTLMKVALADGYKHNSENRILQNACKVWKLDMPLAS